MKNKTHGLMMTALLFTLLAAAPTTSLALFGGAKSRLLRQADDKYVEAVNAGKQGRVLDEMSSLTEARALYMKLSKDHPDYDSKHVSERFNLCVIHLRALTASIKSGEISVPSPDAIVTGAGEGYVDPNAIADPARKSSVPDLNSVAPPALPSEKAAVGTALPKVDAPSSGRVLIKTDFRKPMRSPSIKTNELKASAAGSTPPPAPKSAVARADDHMRVLLINELIRSNEASEAMMILEDIIESEDESASDVTRLLFVRSLMECRNYKRAEDELNIVAAKNQSSPSTRSLTAALAVQKGNLTEAVFQLDRLIQDYPAYSDAYINLAYVYLMMNPVKNRDMAIVYYRSAISYGAKRDPRLESDLNIEIVP